MTKDFLDTIKEQMKSRIASRVGYVESEHPDEVLKGACMAIEIVREEMKRQNIVSDSIYHKAKKHGSGCIDTPRQCAMDRLDEIPEAVENIKKLLEDGEFINENHPDYLHKLAYEVMLFIKQSNGAHQMRNMIMFGGK